ncbi:hypothetical protein KC363_g4005 [Hortaea werneckii]|uniref:TFIIS N-terminal domain-containing protein n=1 Tax=Hortaea werneckii TaxID=91943 RepID=A0A3M7FQ80_HORWE|nr:hypothetical protein KC363_g4005 [Hortaea werneckii]KAI7509913.1 hypothetical protein KC347_g4802 [Hortaea werneckii]RMY90953.1 hypothetical protein D0861_03378 [Hortaea werneckii]
MEDLEAAPGSPALQDTEEPQGNNDPRDPLNPGIDEEDHGRTPPLAHPTADPDAFEDEQAPETAAAMREDEERADEGPAAAAEDEDGVPHEGGEGAAGGDDDNENESELDELDEGEFEDFDPDALNIPDKPVAVDSDNVGLLGVHKRKRTEEEERERKKKKKEGRREKKSKRVKAGGDEDEVDEGDIIEGKRGRKGKSSGGGGGGEKKARARRSPSVDEENMTPEERRRRALDKKMDEALKSHRPTARRRGRGDDLDAMADAEIETMRQRMAKACELDANARSNGKPATNKLAIIGEVTEMLNKNTIQAQLVDPDTNILEAVRFMLEPADHDGALPNYRIQRELFQSLGRMNIGKEALVASGIGKVVLFYTKSIQPQPEIKRAAEKLIGEWMRVVLNKPKSTKSRPVEQRTYDPMLATSQAARRLGDGTMSQAEKNALAAEKRRKILAAPTASNRARVEGSGIGTYSIAPVNNLSNVTMAGDTKTGSGEAFRRIAARSALSSGKSKK